MSPRTPFHVHPYRGVERERLRDTGRDRVERAGTGTGTACGTAKVNPRFFSLISRKRLNLSPVAGQVTTGCEDIFPMNLGICYLGHEYGP